MSKLYCEYDHGIPKTEPADHKCDICGKLLCKICGYNKDEKDYCNECWGKREIPAPVMSPKDEPSFYQE